MQPWDERFYFRLQKEDEDLYQFLVAMPSKQRSEAIRNMLRFAYSQMQEIRQQNKILEQVVKNLDEVKREIASQSKLIQQLRTGESKTRETEETEEKNQTEESMRKSAMAFLELFEGDEDEKKGGT